MQSAPPATVALTLPHDVRIVVPGSLENLTHYVVREQGDWFEDEVRYVRKLLQPGQKCVDIGANLGVYALQMARIVGENGHVWAFEPVADTASLLEQSVQENGFGNVTVVREAVADATGTARMSIGTSSELNRLVDQADDGSATVALTSLDAAIQRFGWTSVAFVKIDAEGAEERVINGGLEALRKLDPIVMFEIKDKAANTLSAARRLEALGYDIYRLVPGLQILVPFDIEAAKDTYLLNLFAVSAARAKKLETRSLLATRDAIERALTALGPQRFEREYAETPQYHWSRYLVRYPYGQRMQPIWSQKTEDDSRPQVERALWAYARSRDTELDAAERFAALELACTLQAEVVQKDPAYLRLSTLARLLAEYGARSAAVNVLRQILTRAARVGVDLSEPFLLACAGFDSVEPGDGQGRWAIAALVEAIETLIVYSSRFDPRGSHARLEQLGALGFRRESMTRRRDVLLERVRAHSA